MSATGKQYQNLRIKGPISVVPVTPEDVKGKNLDLFLLMGPTGSGKSTFIEALSPDQNLEISKDSLESVTQEVNCYRVVNLIRGTWNVVLLDTPGFLDTKLSESRITAKITSKLNMIRQSPATVVVRILYFQPITDTRLGGTKRDAFKLLRAFANSFRTNGIFVITTMWNHISTPKQINDANHRFSCLEDEVFVISNNLHIDVIKFEFSLDSALSILDTVFYGWIYDANTSQQTDPHYQSLLLKNLIDRITNTQLQLHILAEDKQNATTPGREDPHLLEVVLRDEKAALSALQSFLDDIVSIEQTGLTALVTLLDAQYNTDPSSCRSLWPHSDIPLEVPILVHKTLPIPDQSSVTVPFALPTPSAIQSFLDDLQLFLDDIYEKHPQSCSSPYHREGVTQSLPPPPPPLSPSPSSKQSFPARLKTVTLPIQKIFKKL